jgi:serine/threonine protein kinase
MEILNDIYRVDNVELGNGGFGKVFLGTNLKTQERVAVKKISLAHKTLSKTDVINKLLSEIDVMQRLHHPNIIAYYDTVKMDNYWYIIMEYCNKGTLEDVIKYNNNAANKLSNNDIEANTFYYLDQLRDAIGYIRSFGYTHRDIKPLNILLKADCDSSTYDRSKRLIVKLADFGLTKNCLSDDISIHTICGSPLYMAPEILLNKEYNTKADLWSFGIIMYQMLFGINPSIATNFNELIYNLRNKDIDFRLNRNFSVNCYDLLTKLLVKDNNNRISWDNFFDHDWFITWKNQNNIDSFPVSKPIEISQNKSLFPSIIENSPISSLGISNLSKVNMVNSFLRRPRPVKYSDYSHSYPTTKHNTNNLMLSTNQQSIDSNNSMYLSKSSSSINKDSIFESIFSMEGNIM